MLSVCSLAQQELCLHFFNSPAQETKPNSFWSSCMRFFAQLRRWLRVDLHWRNASFMLCEKVISRTPVMASTMTRLVVFAAVTRLGLSGITDVKKVTKYVPVYFVYPSPVPTFACYDCATATDGERCNDCCKGTHLRVGCHMCIAEERYRKDGRDYLLYIFYTTSWKILSFHNEGRLVCCRSCRLYYISL